MPAFLGKIPDMFFATLLLAATVVHPAAAPALDEFAAAWSAIGAYSATLSTHETEGKRSQDRTYAYTFAKPGSATFAITAGPGRGGKVVWSGGDDVLGSPPGLLSGIKLRLSIHDKRVTSLRGDTVAMASFGWVLDHFRSTPGTTTQKAGPSVDGMPTSEVALAVASPATNDGVTAEVVRLSLKTKLPVEVERYIGTSLVKDVRYSNVVSNPAAQP
ncbi:MAG: hypothetical protein NVSMB5_00420 [Candidatus Velthaea sp.]